MRMYKLITHDHLIKELEFAFVPRKRFFVNNTSLKTKIQRKPTRSRTNNMLIALHPLFSFRFVALKLF